MTNLCQTFCDDCLQTLDTCSPTTEWKQVRQIMRTWKIFPHYWPFVRKSIGHRWIPDSPLKRPVKSRSHCADHSLPMFPIIADRPDLSWSWQNHQIVALAPDLCLSKTASTILVRQLYDTGTTEVFDPLLVRFPRPLVRPLIRSTRLRARCWRPHPRSCRLLPRLKRPSRLKNDPVTLLPTFRRPLYATHDHQYVTGTIWPTIATTMYQIGVIASIGIDW